MPKEIDKQETREIIVDAAERLLDRYGYSKMTMNDLAEEAGIGVGTTYLYFAGKADVALAVVERISRSHMCRLQEIADMGEAPSEKLRKMLEARVQLRLDMARSQQHPTDEFARDIKAVIGSRCVPWKETETRIFAGVLQEGCDSGDFSEIEIEPTVVALLSATYGLLPHNLSPKDFADPNSVYERSERIARLLVRGLRPCDQAKNNTPELFDNHSEETAS